MRFPSILALLPVLAAAQPTMMERAEAKSMIQISDHSVNFFFCPNIPRCVDALTSISDVCVRAAEDLGLNFLLDAACLTSAISAGIHIPGECIGCF